MRDRTINGIFSGKVWKAEVPSHANAFICPATNRNAINHPVCCVTDSSVQMSDAAGDCTATYCVSGS